MYLKIKDLRTFLTGSQNNVWIDYEEMSVYVRKGIHFWNDRTHQTFDIANVSVNPTQRGQGIFTDWLSIVENEAKKKGF